jgi:hypothetical protein
VWKVFCFIVCGRDVESYLFQSIRNFNIEKSPFIEFIKVEDEKERKISPPPKKTDIQNSTSKSSSSPNGRISPASQPPPPPAKENEVKILPECKDLINFAYSLVLRKLHFEKPCSFFIHNHRLLSLLIGELLNQNESKDLEPRTLLVNLFGHPDTALLIAQEVVVLWVVLAQSRIDLWEKSSFPLDPFLKIYDGHNNGFLVSFMQ